MTASDCQGETQESEQTLGKKRGVPTILSVLPLSVQDASWFCPKEPLIIYFSPCPCKDPAGTPSSATLGEEPLKGPGCGRQILTPFFSKNPHQPYRLPAGQWACQTAALYPRWGMGVLSTPGLGQSPRSLFPPWSSGQAWEKPGSSNTARGQKQAQIRVHFYSIPSGFKEMPDPGNLSTRHPHPCPPSPPSHQGQARPDVSRPGRAM